MWSFIQRKFITNSSIYVCTLAVLQWPSGEVILVRLQQCVWPVFSGWQSMNEWFKKFPTIFSVFDVFVKTHATGQYAKTNISTITF